MVGCIGCTWYMGLVGGVGAVRWRAGVVCSGWARLVANLVVSTAVGLLHWPTADWHSLPPALPCLPPPASSYPLTPAGQAEHPHPGPDPVRHAVCPAHRQAAHRGGPQPADHQGGALGGPAAPHVPGEEGAGRAAGHAAGGGLAGCWWAGVVGRARGWLAGWEGRGGLPPSASACPGRVAGCRDADLVPPLTPPTLPTRPPLAAACRTPTSLATCRRRPPSRCSGWRRAAGRRTSPRWTTSCHQSPR